MSMFKSLPWCDDDGNGTFCIGIGRSPFTYYHTIVKISVAITPPVCRSVTCAGNLEREEESFLVVIFISV